MSSEKSLAIVTGVVEFSETSCVVTLFTRDFGKISALAKGARRPKSPFDSAIDVLTLCRIVFIHKSSDALDLLTEARLERRFRAASRDLARLYAGYYVAELLNELTDAGDPHPALFHAADVALAALDGDAELPPTVLRFELTALRVLGHLPSLDVCAGCGQRLAPAPRRAFGQLAGGVLCGACRVGQRQVVSVSAEAIDVMKRYAAQPETASPPHLERHVGGQLRGVVNGYIANLVGRRPRMHQYLGMLAS